MQTLKTPAVPAIERNALSRLQLKIARRADQLARRMTSDPLTDVALWLQAEEEILKQHSETH